MGRSPTYQIFPSGDKMFGFIIPKDPNWTRELNRRIGSVLMPTVLTCTGSIGWARTKLLSNAMLNSSPQLSLFKHPYFRAMCKLLGRLDHRLRPCLLHLLRRKLPWLFLRFLRRCHRQRVHLHFRNEPDQCHQLYEYCCKFLLCRQNHLLSRIYKRLLLR